MVNQTAVGATLLIIGILVGAVLTASVVPVHTTTTTETQIATETSVQTVTENSASTITITASETFTTSFTSQSVLSSVSTQTESTSFLGTTPIDSYNQATSASYLDELYKLNQASADLNYTGKDILLIGNVSSVTKDPDGSYSSITPSIQWNWLNATIASQVNLGTWFLATCNVAGLIQSSLELNTCTTIFSSSSQCSAGAGLFVWEPTNPGSPIIDGKFVGGLNNLEQQPITSVWLVLHGYNVETDFLSFVATNSSSLPPGNNSSSTISIQSTQSFPTYNTNTNQPGDTLGFISQVGNSQNACFIPIAYPINDG